MGSPSAVAPGRHIGEDEYRMVKIELEAAEALAGLAHSAARGARESVIQRVNDESTAAEQWLNAEDLGRKSDTEDQAALVLQQCENTRNILTETTRTVQVSEVIPSSMCTTSHEPSGSYKPRLNLTEAEKEAKRLRRVLANRESARQTIRRRQAIYEELTRKAADLAMENDNLNREKELVMKEYNSLKTANECLKAQMAKAVNDAANEIQEKTSKNYPIFIYNRPSFIPPAWASIVQSSNPIQYLQYSPQNDIYNPDSSIGLGTPLYIVPCPWFLPLPNNSCSTGVKAESIDLNDKPLDVAYSSNQCSTSSSLEKKVKTEPRSPSHLPDNSTNEHRFVSAAVSSERPATAQENSTRMGGMYGIKTVASEANFMTSDLPVTNKELVVCSINGRETAAIAARRRRKELTKLKNLRHRHFRLQL